MRKNKIILAVLILSVIALVFTGCGGMGNPVVPPPSEPEVEMIIPDTTKIADEETEAQLTSVSPDQREITFAQSTPQLEELQIGDILFIGVTDQTPYGLLRKVTSISRGLTKESQVVLDTEFTTLEEAIQKGHWEYNHILKPEDIEKGFVFPEGIRPVRGKASTTLDFEYQIDIILYDQDDNPTTTEDNIKAAGYLAFDYQIIFDGDIDGHTLKYFIFKNIIQTDSKLDVSVGASVSIADLADVEDVTIGKPIPFTPVTVYIPTPIPGIFIPLVFFPSIELKAGIEGEAHILLEVGVRQTASYTAGIEFTEGNWQNITIPPQIDYYEDPIEINGGIHVIAHAGPQLNCKLYKVTGPYCKIFGYFDFEADTTFDPWWDLDARLKVLAGVELDIFSVHWGSDELELIKTPWFDITDAGGPFEDEEDFINLNAWTITGYDPYCIMTFGDEYIPNRSMFLYWSKISGAEGYKIYRSVNGSNPSDLVYYGDGIFHNSLNIGVEEIGWFDFDTNPGNNYSYKVSYVKDDQEIMPSEIITRSVWLPECSLSSPTDYNPEDPNDQPVIDPNQLLQWNSVNISHYPYQGEIFSGMTEIWVCYYDTPYPVVGNAENIWSESFNNLITSSIRFDPNNADTPLIPGEDHLYAWETRAVGYDNTGEVIAMSWSGARHFFYMGPSAF